MSDHRLTERELGIRPGITREKAVDDYCPGYFREGLRKMSDSDGCDGDCDQCWSLYWPKEQTP